MLLRAVDAAAALAPPDPSDPPSRFAQSAEMSTALKRTLETIAMAKVSTSAAEARALGLLLPADRITLNRERLLLDAKAQAIGPGRGGLCGAAAAHADSRARHGVACGAEDGRLSDGRSRLCFRTRQKVARWAAYILCGGRVTAGTLVSEQYLLDLEREAFLSLCGERKTQERDRVYAEDRQTTAKLENEVRSTHSVCGYICGLRRFRRFRHRCNCPQRQPVESAHRDRYRPASLVRPRLTSFAVCQPARFLTFPMPLSMFLTSAGA